MCKRIVMHNQSEYYKFILNNHQPSECVVIVDYKMKLKLGIRSREIQRDWYGKWGLSVHGFLVVAQVGDDEKRTEVIDLWSKDTKQDACFSQSTMLLLAGTGTTCLPCAIYFLVSGFSLLWSGFNYLIQLHCKSIVYIMFETSTSLKKIETMKLNDVHVFDTFTFAEIALSLVLQWYILFVSSKNPPVRTYIFLSQAK